MQNPPNKKERGLVKGALRRVFSRSELRRKVIDASLLKEYHDPSRKRVTRWSKCAICKKLEATYKMQVDHLDPIQPLGITLDEMSWDQIIDNLWCDESKLQAVCIECHKEKSKLENSERRRIKKLKVGIKSE